MCGEALVDLVPQDATTYTALPGGSPANTAVALARLGVPVVFLARLSRDSSGALLRAHLEGSDVDLSHAVDALEPSSVALVELSPEGAATYRFLLEGTADWQWRDEELEVVPPEVHAVHAGSLALARQPGGRVLERFLARARSRATVSIDPNLRPALLGDLDAVRTDVRRWLAVADVFKASTEDLQVLHPGEDPEDVARCWAASGPALVVVTCAADGAFAVHGDTLVRRPAVPVDVVDTVGAGDTFMAGLLEQLHRDGQLGGRLRELTPDLVAAALERGLRAAAVTCGRAGADPPWATEL